jgi:hypothetical protein
MKKNSNEYDNFEHTMRELIKVPHSEIKAKLDAEKAAKKRKNSRRSSSSREAQNYAECLAPHKVNILVND